MSNIKQFSTDYVQMESYSLPINKQLDGLYKHLDIQRSRLVRNYFIGGSRINNNGKVFLTETRSKKKTLRQIKMEKIAEGFAMTEIVSLKNTYGPPPEKYDSRGNITC
jgi:hypothetical protein